MQTILTPKDRHQKSTKNERNKLSQYNINILHILTFQVLSRFSANFLVLSRFSHFWAKFQAISGPGQIKFKSPGIPGSAGNPDQCTTKKVCKQMFACTHLSVHQEKSLCAVLTDLDAPDAELLQCPQHLGTCPLVAVGMGNDLDQKGVIEWGNYGSSICKGTIKTYPHALTTSVHLVYKQRTIKATSRWAILSTLNRIPTRGAIVMYTSCRCATIVMTNCAIVSLKCSSACYHGI